MPLGWGDIDWQGIFSELTFLPDTVLMMEIGRRYRAEQPAKVLKRRVISCRSTLSGCRSRLND